MLGSRLGVEFDIKGLFDNISHELLLKAVRRHIQCKWALIYIERWLKAPMVKDGERMSEIAVPPQGRDKPDSSKIYSYTIRLTSGWNGNILTSHGVGMQMTDGALSV